MERGSGTGIILLNSRRKVLLFLRDDKSSIPFPNMWDLLGGLLDSGESPEDGIRREIREEIEIELGSINFFRKYNFENRNIYIFWKEIDLDLADTKLNEGQRLEYFNEDDISKIRLAFNFNLILHDFFNFLNQS
ncbi:MAG: NUDIX domain-containing protein [Leptolyngbyaceae cyanobacterium CSU_1_3]|nr:NUDIX domain-containing protein [Leptolyngbyaceae cyanobacterium CSU_1_3]